MSEIIKNIAGYIHEAKQKQKGSIEYKRDGYCFLSNSKRYRKTLSDKINTRQRSLQIYNATGSA
jgi:hypothetical protein